eukprot:NODE_1608_length_1473_cov_28.516854_g1450_i0.p1 GENE.NODE_1608_length_1473_cov_28.516854_g1450_i0~~NODE_1608_length_1473_cov_28.516854_g1450_i0.p1  ORF type:complete len:376 (+),score=41.11 NODE_1608_length_1473_cov_28.516854_g1450_i0:132-1259(+)
MAIRVCLVTVTTAAFLLLVGILQFVTKHQSVRPPPPSSDLVARGRPPGTKYYAVMSATFSGSYSFYLPLTVMVWNQLNISSIVFLVGPRWDSPLGKIILRELMTSKAIAQYVEVPHGVPLSLVSQHVRFYAGHLRGIPDDAVLISTDADIWPVHRDLYLLSASYAVRSVDAYAFPFFVINEKASSTGTTTRAFKSISVSRQNSSLSGKKIYPQFPITNIMMTAESWRVVVPCNITDLRKAGEFIWSALGSFLGYRIRQVETGRRGEHWFLDQFWISMRIVDSPFYPSQVEFVRRKTLIDRMQDKHIWCPRENLSLTCSVVSKLHDIHNPREPGNQWWCLRAILECLLSPAELQRASTFMKKYQQRAPRLRVIAAR